MKPRLIWSALLAFALAVGLLAWLTPSAPVGATGSKIPEAERRGWSPSPPSAPKFTQCVNPGGTSGCFASIQTAINASSYGDQINVASGWYTEHITMTNGVSIYGAGWDTGTGTVITGAFSAALPTVSIPWSVGASTVLSGVQVSGGGNGDPNTSPNGGGISIGGSPTIINTWVNNNTGRYGGGVYISGGSPALNNVPVWNSRALYGGGFYLTNNAVVTMTANLFDITSGSVYSNSTDGEGGGFYMSGVTVTLSGLHIYSNTASYGGGMYVYSTSNAITLLGNDISLNSATHDGGGLDSYAATNLQVGFNIFNGNTGSNRGGAAHFQRSAGQFAMNLVLGNKSDIASGYGGGLYVWDAPSSMNIDGNWFEGNSAFHGGALDVDTNAVALVNANVIVTNTAYSGGGLDLSGASAVTITNNIIARNIVSPTTAGGMQIGTTPARITNNTIAHNGGNGVYFFSSDGIVIANNIIHENYAYGIYGLSTTTYTIDYNDLFGNSYFGLPPGAHDQSVDADFVASGDIRTFYHILPTSPVSKTGSLIYAPAKDIDGEARALCISRGADNLNCVTNRLYLPLIKK